MVCDAPYGTVLLQSYTMVYYSSSLYLLQVDDEEPESLEGSDGVGEVLLGNVHLLDIPRDLLHLQRCTHKHTPTVKQEKESCGPAQFSLAFLRNLVNLAM